MCCVVRKGVIPGILPCQDDAEILSHEGIILLEGMV
jgi:hypothetical protein